MWRRRQIQLQSGGGLAVPDMARRIFAREGVPGFYRGFLPNALKNLPNKGAGAARVRVRLPAQRAEEPAQQGCGAARAA